MSEILRQTYARHIIDNVEDAEAPALGELVMDEVERPARVDLGLDQDRRARSDRFPPSLALADGQPFFAVEPIDAVDADGSPCSRSRMNSRR